VNSEVRFASKLPIHFILQCFRSSATSFNQPSFRGNVSQSLPQFHPNLDHFVLLQEEMDPIKTVNAGGARKFGCLRSSVPMKQQSMQEVVERLELALEAYSRAAEVR